MSKQVITQADSMSAISAKMSQNYDELLELIYQGSGQPHTDQECFDAFVAEMNRYAGLFGMADTLWNNPSGLPDDNNGHYSCARDLAKMVACATAYPKLMEYWGQTEYSVPVGGPNARTISGVSTYKGDAMTTVGDYYHIFGGKSGSITWHSVRYENLILVCKSKVDDAWLAGCIMYNTNLNPPDYPKSDRGVAFKEMLDWLEDYRVNPEVSAPTIQAQYCSAFVVPPHTATAYQDMTLEQVGKASTTHGHPASTTKLMTAIIVFDHLSMNDTLTIKDFDITSGSGDTFYAGDTLKVSDAILAMMLPSSNTLATAFARVVGGKILNGR